METAKALAHRIAKAFGGRVKRDDLPWDVLPPCDFRVEGSHGGRALNFLVFDDGCVVEGTTTRKHTTGISFNRPFARVSKRVTAGLPQCAPPIFHINGLNELVPFPADVQLRIDDEVRAFYANRRNREALDALALAQNELLVLLTQPVFTKGRPTFLLLHSSPDLDALQARLDVLAQLFPAVPAGADIVREVSPTAYRIKVTKRGAPKATPHRFGGSLESLLKCRNCKTPIHLILTIDTRDPALKLARLGRRRFPIVYCLNCRSWDLLYVDYSKDKLRIVRQDKAERVNDDEALEERPITLEKLDSPKTSASKIGGSPKWLQGPSVPDCARCDKPMAFLAQVRSTPDLGFGDDGTLYSFVCAQCRIAASFIQSS